MTLIFNEDFDVSRRCPKFTQVFYLVLAPAADEGLSCVYYTHRGAL